MANKWITVWEFRSPSTGETAVVKRTAEPNDYAVQHEYQRILYRGPDDPKRCAAWRVFSA